MKKTPVFKDNQALNSTLVTEFPKFMTYDSSFITIEGDNFTEGWNMYNFRVTATIFKSVINNEFLFTVDTLIDCSDSKIIPKFNSTIYYLISSPANI